MNNLRLLAGLISYALLSGAVYSYGQQVTTLEEVFKVAEDNSIQLRPFVTAQNVAKKKYRSSESGTLARY